MNRKSFCSILEAELKLNSFSTFTNTDIASESKLTSHCPNRLIRYRPKGGSPSVIAHSSVGKVEGIRRIP